VKIAASSEVGTPADPGVWRRLAGLDARLRAVIVGAVIAFAHAPSFARRLLDSDEAVYAAIAALLNDGGRLYAEGGVDNKFPGIYWTYALLFRVFGRYAMWSVHAAALVVVLATSWILSRIALRAHGPRAAWLAGLAYGVLTIFYYPKMQAANTEVFMSLPLAASVLLSLPDEEKRCRPPYWFFVAGALIGFSAMYRQLAALNVIVSMAAPLLARGSRVRRFSAAAMVPLGFVAAFAVLFAAYAVQGNLGDFLYWAVTMVTTRYLPGGWHYGWPGLQLLAMLAVMLVPAALVALRARRFREAGTVERIVWLWLVVGTFAILMLWRFHPHYVIHAVAPVAVLAALELDIRLSTMSEVAKKRLVALLLVVIGIESTVFFVLALVLEPIAGGFEPPKPNYPPVAAYIGATTKPSDRVFVWGAWAPLYVLSDRLPASRFVGFMRGCPRHPEMPLYKCWDAGIRTWEVLADEMARASPELIVDTAAADYGGFAYYPLASVPLLKQLVASSYRLESTVEGVPIYRHNPR
jgi:hypothetical protein